MINKIPKVGRIAVLESYMRGGFFRRGGVIKTVTEKSVVFTDPQGADRRALKTSLAVVCDYAEEVERLMEFEKRTSAERSALAVQQRKERDELLADAATPAKGERG